MTDPQTVIKTKVVFLLAAGASGRDALGEAVRTEASRLRTELGDEIEVRSAGPADTGDAQSRLSGEDRAAYDGGSPFSALLWLAAPAGRIDALTAASEGLAGRLGAALDPHGSAAVAGHEETYIAGDGPVVAMYSIRRPEQVSYADCHDFWRLEHTKLSMHVPDFRYRQLHAIGGASGRVSEAAGVARGDHDGIVVMHMDSMDWVQEIADEPLVAELYEDEKNFIDHARSEYTFFRFFED